MPEKKKKDADHRTRMQVEFSKELTRMLDELAKDLDVPSRVDAIRLAVKYLRRITKVKERKVTVSFSDGVLVFHEYLDGKPS